METPRLPRDSLSDRTFPANQLARDFGIETRIAQEGIRALHEAARDTRPPGLGRWRRLLGEASGGETHAARSEIATLAACCKIPAAEVESDALLFAAQTYYALLARLLAGQAVAARHGAACPTEPLRRAENTDRLRAMQRFEAGETFRRFGLDGCFQDHPFSWYVEAWSRRIGDWTGCLANRLASYGNVAIRNGFDCGHDRLKGLYQGLFSRALRHRLGEFYTPDWLAGHVLDLVVHDGQPGRRLLDPSCGSGTFLLAAIRRMRTWHEAGGEQCGLNSADLCRAILAGVVGFDLNPVAAVAACANYLIAIADILPSAEDASSSALEIPIYLCDSILDRPLGEDTSCKMFDHVVGNPPWIAWDHLPEAYRQATKPLWQQYGLFSLSGKDGRLGGGKKDVAMLMLYRSADRYLRDGGHLAMVVTQTLFQTKGAGDGFRRFRLGPEGSPLEVLRVDDMVALKPFEDAANWTATILLRKGTPTKYPVPYWKWSAGGTDEPFVRRPFHAEPIDASRPSSPWFLRPEGFAPNLSDLIGPSDYAAHLGANSGGANGVYWLNILGSADCSSSSGPKQAPAKVRVENMPGRGKRQVELVRQAIEPDLLYPLIRWGDVSRFHAVPSAYLLLAQDAKTRVGVDLTTMQRQLPETLAYLSRFERELRQRAAFRRYQAGHPFYSMYNVGPYTVEPIKVVWRRMDRRIRAAVVVPVDDPLLGKRPVIPQETCVLVACDSIDEAHYVCAVMNSSVVNFLIVSHSVSGGKGFGTPSLLDFIRLRRFEPTDPHHMELSQCSREAHRLAAAGDDTARVELRIDRLAAGLWGLSDGDVDAILP